MIIFLNLLAANTGGQITRAKAYLDNINLIDPNVQTIVLKNNSVLNNYVSNKSITIINTEIGQGKFRAIKRIIWENLYLPKLVSNYKADVFLTFSHYLPIKKIAIPTIVGVSNLAPFSLLAIHEESVINKIKLFLLKKTILSSTQKADLVLALSNTAKEVLIMNGIRREKIYVNHIGVDDFWFKHFSKESDDWVKLKIDFPFFLYVSHFYRYKNHLRLIEAFSKIPETIKGNRKLLLVGKPEDINYFNQIRTLINDLNLNNSIIIIPGSTSETLRILYQSTDLFIFPSLVENCPNILLEAMASGAPVITVDIEPMVEYCQESADYFDGLSVDSILSQMIKFCESNTRCYEMKNYSKVLIAKYSWSLFIRNILEESYKIIKK